MGKTILYARLSTSDQTVEHQREQAEKAGFEIDKVITDNGVSGISTKLSERPQVKRLFDILQSGDTLVVRWIDRLGRDYRDVSDTIRHFMREGVVIKTVINAIVFDGATTDPIQQAVRDALIAFMAAMAQAPRRQSPRRRLSGPKLRRLDPTRSDVRVRAHYGARRPTKASTVFCGQLASAGPHTVGRHSGNPANRMCSIQRSRLPGAV